MVSWSEKDDTRLVKSDKFERHKNYDQSQDQLFSNSRTQITIQNIYCRI